MSKPDYFKLLELPSFSDGRGSLVVMESTLPFPIMRTYWIFEADYQLRGEHRHRETRQALVAIAGTITVHMDDGIEHQDVVLDSPSKCLLVEPKDWHSMSFGSGAILLVFASRFYDRSDYISDKYQ